MALAGTVIGVVLGLVWATAVDWPDASLLHVAAGFGLGIAVDAGRWLKSHVANSQKALGAPQSRRFEQPKRSPPRPPPTPPPPAPRPETDRFGSFDPRPFEPQPQPDYFAASGLAIHFAALEIAPTTDLAIIKRAYRAAIEQYHPDKVATRGKAIRDIAHEKTLSINRAYEELTRVLGRS